MNDLHTGSLTSELAALTGAAALINATADRNEIDLNRITATHDAAPQFLELLADLVESVLDRHGRATLMTIHGWNVVQPALDIGLGCTPGADPLAVDGTAAVSASFARNAVARLVRTCSSRGLDASIGARYPARARENLLQLFTTRHRNDPRPSVRRLAALGVNVQAMQLELGIPLRWPGVWRGRLASALLEVLPALIDGVPGAGQDSPLPPTDRPPVQSPPWTALRFVSPSVGGLVRCDANGGGLLVLLPSSGGLVLYTGERRGALEVVAAHDGLIVRYCGPLVRFPDTSPFLDLEHGLARASLVEADVALRFAAHHADTPGHEFGRVNGSVRLGGEELAIAGNGLAESASPRPDQPHFRVGVDLGDGRALSATMTVAGGHADGFVCTDGRHIPVVGGWVRPGADDPLGPLALEVVLADGTHLALAVHGVQRLPVVRGRGTGARRLLFATCRVEGTTSPAGWCELTGVG